MNRKKYIQPSTEVMLASITQVVCLSLDGDNPTGGLGPSGPGYGGTNDDDEEVDAGSNSRGAWAGDLWSDRGVW